MATVYERNVALRNNFAINASTYTDLQGSAAVPIACNTIVVFNPNNVDVYMRTNPANANSQKTIGPGEAYQFGLSTPLGSGSSNHTPGNFRFPLNCSPVASFLSSSGNVDLEIECTA